MFEWYEDEVRWLEQKRAGAPESPVAFYGSSSIRLWDTLAGDFAPAPVVNLGFGGSTLAACAYFFERVVLPYEPCSLIFYAGDNDIGDGRSPADILGSFDELWAKRQRSLPPDLPFGFISIKPSLARWNAIDAIRAVNEGVRATLDSDPHALYLDIYTPMLNDQGQPRPELFAEDGLHLSRAGYAVWRQVIADHRHALRL